MANGVTDASYVTISCSPTSGYHQSPRAMSEADINQPNPTFFMRLFSFNFGQRLDQGSGRHRRQWGVHLGSGEVRNGRFTDRVWIYHGAELRYL